MTDPIWPPPRPRRPSDPVPHPPADWEFDCPGCSTPLMVDAVFVRDVDARGIGVFCPKCGSYVGAARAPGGEMITAVLDDGPEPEGE